MTEIRAERSASAQISAMETAEEDRDLNAAGGSRVRPAAGPAVSVQV
ncbi:MAG: hypothetical protein ACLSHO_13400 [Dysosmobacter sp.]